MLGCQVKFNTPFVHRESHEEKDKVCTLEEASPALDPVPEANGMAIT